MEENNAMWLAFLRQGPMNYQQNIEETVGAIYKIKMLLLQMMVGSSLRVRSLKGSKRVNFLEISPGVP